MFYTYFGDVEPNYSNLKRIEGHLRSIRAISRSCQGRTHKLLLYASVTHVSYLIWGHKHFYIIIKSIEWHLRSIHAISSPFQGQTR